MPARLPPPTVLKTAIHSNVCLKTNLAENETSQSTLNFLIKITNPTSDEPPKSNPTNHTMLRTSATTANTTARRRWVPWV